MRKHWNSLHAKILKLTAYKCITLHDDKYIGGEFQCLVQAVSSNVWYMWKSYWQSWKVPTCDEKSETCSPERWSNLLVDLFSRDAITHDWCTHIEWYHMWSIGFWGDARNPEQRGGAPVNRETASVVLFLNICTTISSTSLPTSLEH